MEEELLGLILANDTKLSKTDEAKNGLQQAKYLAILRVEDHMNNVGMKLNERKDQLISEITTSYEKQMEKLEKMRTSINKGSLELSKELRIVQNKLENVDKANFNRIKVSMESLENPENFRLNFHPSTNTKLTKLRKGDIGFVQVSDCMPENFNLVLSTPPSQLTIGGKVTCSLITDKEFTQANQEHICFAIKNKSCGESVPICKDQSKVSADKKIFNITFRSYRSGTYVVTVYIYGDQPVANSPLSVTVPDFSVVPPEATGGVRPPPLLLAPPPAVRQLVTSPHTPSSPSTTLLPPASNLLPPATPKTPAGVVIQSLLSTNNVQQPSKMPKTRPGQSPPRRRYNNQPASVTVGERVVAKWSGNGQYYEGTIFLVNQDSAIVMFKEGGTSETVALSDIQPINPTSTPISTAPPINHSAPLPQHQPPASKSSVPPTSRSNPPAKNHRSGGFSISEAPPLSNKTDWVATALSNDHLLRGKCEFSISPTELALPIGVAILNNNNILVSDAADAKQNVKMFDPTGKFIKVVRPGHPFVKPSDMTTLRSGNFAVRDDFGIQIFDKDGNFQKAIGSQQIDKCFGLAEDDEGHLVTLNYCRPGGNRNGKGGGRMTAPGETDVFFISIEEGAVVRRVELADIIQDKRKSKCRFLRINNGRVYITDLGMDCVYVLDPLTNNVKWFGRSGSADGQFNDPAGLVVDDVGNMVIADSKNHRLQLFDSRNKFVCQVQTDTPIRRPSGVSLHNGDIYVLNLQGKAKLAKYKLW